MFLEELAFGVRALEEWRRNNYQSMNTYQRIRCRMLCFGMKGLVYLGVWWNQLCTQEETEK